jgi:ribosome recycling factor
MSKEVSNPEVPVKPDVTEDIRTKAIKEIKGLCETIEQIQISISQLEVDYKDILNDDHRAGISESGIHIGFSFD